MPVPEKMHAPADMAECAANWTPVPLLEEIKEHGRVWGELAEQYGVTNPDPPWKTSLDGMCEVLASGSCSSMAAAEKALVGRRCRARSRWRPACPCLSVAGKRMSCRQRLYQDVPFPERQLLALTHSLIKRGLVKDPEVLKARMKKFTKALAAD
jgi:hypothetical protein